MSVPAQTIGAALRRQEWESPNEYGRIVMTMAGGNLATKSRAMSLEVLLGRGLACCLHPQAAWRMTTRMGRAFVVCAYATGGFVATLAALLLF
jgi:hypothetical protein